MGHSPLFVHSVFSHLNTDPLPPNDKLQAFSSARLVFGIIVHWKCRSETAVVPSALQVGAPCGPRRVLKERMCYKSADRGDCARLHHLSQTMAPSWLGWRGLLLLEGWGWGEQGFQLPPRQTYQSQDVRRGFQYCISQRSSIFPNFFNVWNCIGSIANFLSQYAKKII